MTGRRPRPAVRPTVMLSRRRLLTWRRHQQGPRPQSKRPVAVEPPPSEWAWLGLMAIAVGAGTFGWPAVVLRLLGGVAIVGFVVCRIRYRVRRGEQVWLWDRI